jgi:predicted MPP superfamily phosphohydrolase
MMKKPNKKTVLIVSVLVILCLGIWTLWGNIALEVNEYEIVSDRIPEAFAGFRIAQVSDLHNKDFGEGYGQLLTLLSEINPDIIVVTGDLIDSRQTDLDVALEFAWQAGKIARVYYVSGNHEARVPEYEDLKIGLVKAGVVILENQKVQITREGERITLMGIDDPSFQEDYLFGDSESVARQAIEDLQNESDGYTILLSHRPELFDLYVETEMDLVFSGHAHGGQFRLPFIGGLVAPNQGFFPKYDAGQFTEENTTMIVSRGVGNSIIPIRFNNRPEIVLVTLRNMK